MPTKRKSFGLVQNQSCQTRSYWLFTACWFWHGSSSSVVRDLGVLLGVSLSMKQNINKATVACYYQLRQLRQIRPRVGPEVITQLVLTLVTSRLDYCNSVSASYPQSTVEPLQRSRNVARLIFNLRRYGNMWHCASFSCANYHAVRFRITYKLWVREGRYPRYLSVIVLPTSAASATVTRSGLRSLSVSHGEVRHAQVAYQVGRGRILFLHV